MDPWNRVVRSDLLRSMKTRYGLIELVLLLIDFADEEQVIRVFGEIGGKLFFSSHCHVKISGLYCDGSQEGASIDGAGAFGFFPSHRQSLLILRLRKRQSH